MQPHKRISIVTSSPPTSVPLPSLDSCASPMRVRASQRYRTLYVTSTVDPTQWDAETIDNLFTLTEEDQADQSAVQPMRRSRSRGNHLIIAATPGPVPQEPRSAPARFSVYRPQRSNTPVSPIQPVPSRVRPRILFYHKHNPYYGFTNFSPHPVMYNGKTYPTSEHLFQAFKFLNHRPELAEHIRVYSDRPRVAFSEARRFAPEIRKDWEQVRIEKMETALRHKFTQHPDLRVELLSTGDAELVEDSDKDSFWGVGANGLGRNELGKALERLRTALRNGT